MTNAQKPKPPANAKPGESDRTLQVGGDPKKSDGRRLAEIGLNPAATSMATTEIFNKGSFGTQSVTDLLDVMREHIAAAEKGDLSQQRALLVGQASSLNAIFMELARRAGANMGEYINAAQIYMRLALKAQAQCRSTIESLDRLVNGHEQTVKHVHVGQGGQAVVADHIHQHTGGQENAKNSEQPHATGTGDIGRSPALPGPDPFGNGVPIPSREGQPAMQNARRQG